MKIKVKLENWKVNIKIHKNLLNNWGQDVKTYKNLLISVLLDFH